MARRYRYEHDSVGGRLGEINITPLMDLTFLLLIVFMITAPLLEYAVDVSPPELNAETPQDKPHMVVSVDATGRIYVGGVSVTLADLRVRASAAAGRTPRPSVFIRADAARPYGEVVAVMKAVREGGLTDISLLTEPEEEEP